MSDKPATVSPAPEAFTLKEQLDMVVECLVDAAAHLRLSLEQGGPIWDHQLAHLLVGVAVLQTEVEYVSNLVPPNLGGDDLDPWAEPLRDGVQSISILETFQLAQRAGIPVRSLPFKALQEEVKRLLLRR